jgi:tRNA pseudouridine32 synthase/23S rRNA pseudouridine746 synthase
MRWAEQHLEPERTSYTVHRLDLATNGLILVAHSKTVAAELGRLFMERQITKRYRAIVCGDMSQFSEPLLIEQPIDNKAARSEVTFIEVSDDRKQSLVDVRIYTGRKHQIRRHLSSLGHPIAGDRMYGTGNEEGVDLQLTAYLLGFECPVDHVPVEFRLSENLLPRIV